MDTGETNIFRETFPLVLRRKRNALKITQEELADRANTAVRYVGHLERGTRQPTLSTFCALAYALESTPTELMAEFEGELPKDAHIRKRAGLESESLPNDRS